MKKIVYIDMDGTLVDFKSAFPKLGIPDHEGADDIPGIFAVMDPMPGAVDAVHVLREHFDVYVLSTAPWKNPSAWHDKLEWIKEHFGAEEGTAFYKRVILSHHKHLNRGNFLIDDRTANGADRFEGELIAFGTTGFLDWDAVVEYLIAKSGDDA